MKIAQVNIAKMKAPMDSPIMVDFVNNLDHINDIAEKSPGFVWRLKVDTNNATSIKIFDDEFLLVNMSVWDNMDHLFEYVYNSMHGEILKRKKEWFHKMGEMHMAIWYIKNHKYPLESEARERLKYIRKYGETPYSFTFKNKYTTADLKNYISLK